MTKRYVSITDEQSARAEQQKYIAKVLILKDKQALEWMLGNEHGRWFLARLMKNDGMYAKSFTGNSSTFYNEGRRDACLDIYMTIKTQLKLRGIKALHQAQEEMMEFEEQAKRLAEVKEEDDG